MVYRNICGVVLLTVVAAAGASAAERSWQVAGQSLRISNPCAKSVSIEPAGELAGRVEIVATAEHKEEIDRLSVTGGAAASIDKTTSRCYPGSMAMEVGPVSIGIGTSNPTLALTVRVPAGIPIQLRDHGAADYRIGAVGGSLDADFGGSGSLRALAVTELKLDLSGSGDAAIEQVAGRIQGKISGSSNLNLARAVAPSTDLSLSGSGHVAVAEGSLGQTVATLGGSGGMSLPAVGGLQISLAGSGDSVVQRADGPVEAKLAGSGNLKIGQVGAASVNLKSAGNADIRIGGGSIGALSIVSAGSSDIGVDAVVNDANVTLMGSGDVKIPHLTGHLSQSSIGSGRISVGGH